MRVNFVNPPDGPKKPGKSEVGGLPKASGKSFQNELRLSLLISSIKSEMADGNNEAALGAFKTIFAPTCGIPDFAERVLESAPIFAAFVAKIAIDEIMAKLDLEKEKARELKRLAEEYARRAKIVPPTQSL